MSPTFSFYDENDGVEFLYVPVDPVTDNQLLARRRRLILYHDPYLGAELFVARGNGNMYAGWVVGIAADGVNT